MNGDIRNEWRITAIEHKVDDVKNKLHELDNLRSTLDYLKNANKELISAIASTKSDFECYKEWVDIKLNELENPLEN